MAQQNIIDNLSKEQIAVMYNSLKGQFAELQTNYNLTEANLYSAQQELEKLKKESKGSAEPVKAEEVKEGK